MVEIHIYTRPFQPATRYVDDCSGHVFWTRHRARHALWAGCCQQRRWAKYLRVQVYYDQLVFSCKPGHGCRAKEA